MATTFEFPSPAAAKVKESRGLIPSSHPLPEKCFWSTLRSRFDALMENQNPIDRSLSAQMKAEAMEQARRLKQESKFLFRGFDSLTRSLSQISNNFDKGLQGGRDLARPPTFTEILEATIGTTKFVIPQKGENRRGLKRKLDSTAYTESEEEEDKQEQGELLYGLGKLKKAKNLAATDVARESKLEVMQKRCGLLEEENSKLRHRLAKEIERDDDDLVRLQLEALMAEKSRLANENAKLSRENQYLHKLVIMYHQLTSQDLSTSYDCLINETGLDFSCHDGALMNA